MALGFGQQLEAALVKQKTVASFFFFFIVFTSLIVEYRSLPFFSQECSVWIFHLYDSLITSAKYLPLDQTIIPSELDTQFLSTLKVGF